MWAEDPVVLIASSDWHLGIKAPVARSNEKDWYAAQARALDEIGKLKLKHECPLVIAGDLFDDGWRPHRCPPELINFALRQIDGMGISEDGYPLSPDIYSIPGQHDLPHHRYEDIMKSAYWTLRQTAVIQSLPKNPSREFTVKGTPIRLHAFPWGTPIQPLEDPNDLFLEVAVGHEYLWWKECKYEGADETTSVKHNIDRFLGYDVVIVGDNHKGFLYQCDGFALANCGTITRRRSDEEGYKPRVYLVRASGRVEPYYLDTSKDAPFVDGEEPSDNGSGIDTRGILKAVKDLGDKALDFVEVLRRVGKEAEPAVWDEIVKCLEGGKA